MSMDRSGAQAEEARPDMTREDESDAQMRADFGIAEESHVAPDTLVVAPWPEVFIVCHLHETLYLVDHFVKVDYENWIAQSMGPEGTRDLPADPVTGRVKRMRVALPDAFGFVNDKGQWSRNGGGGDPGWTSARFNLRCPECADREAAAGGGFRADRVPTRYRNLIPILDVFAAEGISFVRLVDLAARLQSG